MTCWAANITLSISGIRGDMVHHFCTSLVGFTTPLVCESVLCVIPVRVINADGNKADIDEGTN